MGAWLLVLGVVAGLTAIPLARPVEAASRESREAGAALFHKRGCEFCHGVDGVGTERAPDLSTVGKRKKRPQIEQQILHGGKGMPAFGEVLQPDEVKLLVDFLSAKRKAKR
jgi:mono/diheme cytochrome c family protein